MKPGAENNFFLRFCLYLRPDDPPGALSDTFVQSRLARLEVPGSLVL